MSDPSPRSFSADFKQFFFRGLVVLLPTVLTLWIVVKAYQFIDSAIAEPINRGVRYVMAEATPHSELLRRAFEPDTTAVTLEKRRRMLEPSRRTPTDAEIIASLRARNIQEWWDEFWFGSLDLIGIIVAITGVYFAGRLLGGWFGRRIYRRLEGAIVSLPIIKQVYPSVKQVVDFIFGQERQIEFKRVVLVEYPRKGIWSLGLHTGPGLKDAMKYAGESVTLFIPSSPTPFTGYTITVPREEVIELDMSVDEAIRFTVSGGVLMPDHQTPPELAGKKIVQPRSPLPAGAALPESTAAAGRSAATGSAAATAPRRKNVG